MPAYLLPQSISWVQRPSTVHTLIPRSSSTLTRPPRSIPGSALTTTQCTVYCVLALPLHPPSDRLSRRSAYLPAPVVARTGPSVALTHGGVGPKPELKRLGAEKYRIGGQPHLIWGACSIDPRHPRRPGLKGVIGRKVKGQKRKVRPFIHSVHPAYTTQSRLSSPPKVSAHTTRRAGLIQPPPHPLPELPGLLRSRPRCCRRRCCRTSCWCRDSLNPANLLAKLR
ncbi:hypothetical protein VTK26DRAFT_8368 [Humicola hyalothermophila]